MEPYFYYLLPYYRSWAKVEPGTRAEFNGLVASARKRLADARNETLSSEFSTGCSAAVPRGMKRRGRACAPRG